MAQAVIMAGGPGERFWPLTHKKFPKYRIRFRGKLSLLQRTYRRLAGFYSHQDIYVVTTREHEPMILEDLPRLAKDHILREPFRKNTAAAIFLSSAILAEKKGKGEIVSFFPADHWIEKEALFQKTMQNVMRLAQKHPALVTVGVRPTFPATGYGYVECGVSVPGVADAFRVTRFVEKPDRRKALNYLRHKNFLWNGGIFTWRIDVFMEAMRRFAPVFTRLFDLGQLVKSYRRLPSVSIDYALLERVNNFLVYRTSMDWCDLGSWDTFCEKSASNHKGNVLQGDVHVPESRDCLFFNHTKSPLISLGVSGLIVVQTEQGTLICRRDRSEEAARLAAGVRERGENSRH